MLITQEQNKDKPLTFLYIVELFFSYIFQSNKETPKNIQINQKPLANSGLKYVTEARVKLTRQAVSPISNFSKGKWGLPQPQVCSRWRTESKTAASAAGWAWAFNIFSLGINGQGASHFSRKVIRALVIQKWPTFISVTPLV